MHFFKICLSKSHRLILTHDSSLFISHTRFPYLVNIKIGDLRCFYWYFDDGIDIGIGKLLSIKLRLMELLSIILRSSRDFFDSQALNSLYISTRL